MVLRRAHERTVELRKKVSVLEKRFAIPLDRPAPELHEHSICLRNTKFPFSFWRSDVRSAKLRYREINLTSKSPKRGEMAADFEAIAECNEIATGFATDEQLREFCGQHFRGHETAFEHLVEAAEFAVTIQRIFHADQGVDRLVRELLRGSKRSVLELVTAARGMPHDKVRLLLETLDPQVTLDVQLNRHRELLCKAVDLKDRALALGLKPDIHLGIFQELVDAVGLYRDAEARIAANAQAREFLGAHWGGPHSDRSSINGALQASSAVEVAGLPDFLRRYLYHEDRDERIVGLRQLRERLTGALTAALESWDQAKDGGHIDEKNLFGSAFRRCALREALARIDSALAHTDQLIVWITFLAARALCFESGLGDIVNAFGGKSLDAAQLSRALERVYRRSLARAALAEHPVLSRIQGSQLSKCRERFRELDEEIIKLQRKQLATELSRRPIDPGYKGATAKEHRGLALVYHELGKKKRHIPVRELLGRAGRSIQQLKPCFLMSPLSVAQFLKPHGLRFDLIVIDEASQMRPEEALGAIARGDQLVVGGDPMQLPPTSFFDRTDRILDDEIDEEEIVDNESILDLALAEFRPARSLRWHYRSRHESLIAFSNREFYDDLIVFPSPLDPDRDRREPKLGVYHHFVAGKYKGRVNIDEAQKVAKAAVEFMASEPDRSLGIVTLNQTQRELLLEEIERLIARDRNAEEFIERWENTLEPFFVKNLENVQGDERDVIFISTVYGPDPTTGIVRNQFGPINGRFGFRRLNVLFSRAKHRVEVFTSMRPDDIRPDEKSQRGVHVLKSYLEYAETGRLDAGQASEREPDSEFEQLVRERLKTHGYEAVSQVGVAGYFIDLAVKHPHRSGYIVGIECDGAGYHSSRSARDRDRLRQQVLERLHWNIYRIWSTDWFQNSEAEFRRLSSHLDQLVREDLA